MKHIKHLLMIQVHLQDLEAPGSRFRPQIRIKSKKTHCWRSVCVCVFIIRWKGLIFSPGRWNEILTISPSSPLSPFAPSGPVLPPGPYLPTEPGHPLEPGSPCRHTGCYYFRNVITFFRLHFLSLIFYFNNLNYSEAQKCLTQLWIQGTFPAHSGPRVTFSPGGPCSPACPWRPLCP